MCTNSHVYVSMLSVSTWVPILVVPLNCSQMENPLEEWLYVVDDGLFA